MGGVIYGGLLPGKIKELTEGISVDLEAFTLK